MPNIQAVSKALRYIQLPHFKPVTPTDLPIIGAMLRCATSRSCDYTVGGIFLWVDWFKYEYCIIDNTLFIKGLSENNPNVTAFSLPIGEMPLHQAVDILRHYCAMHNVPLVFSAIPEDSIEAFCTITNSGIEPLDAWSDYVYNASDLATLAGKKFQKKRNHVNRFLIENPGYKFEPVDSENIGEVLSFFDTLSANDDDKSVMALYEINAVRTMLAQGNIYGFEGALLRDNSQQIVAFTFGEVHGDTLHVHIEKMRHDVNGAGAAVNKMYVEQMMQRHGEIRYVNRQDDAGDDGLRRAKLSYNPAFILKKYNIILNNL